MPNVEYRGMNLIVPENDSEWLEFVKAARAQADALGAREYRPVVVPHPIQPLTREEVRLLADKVYDEILARLTKT